MSEEFMLKQIAMLTEMLGEERLDVEKHIINEKLIELYKAKVEHELRERMSADLEMK